MATELERKGNRGNKKAPPQAAGPLNHLMAKVVYELNLIYEMCVVAQMFLYKKGEKGNTHWKKYTTKETHLFPLKISEKGNKVQIGPKIDVS